MIGLYPSERSFTAFKDAIATWNGKSCKDSSLYLLNEALSPRKKPWREFYIPFDYVNEKAKVIILGVTPGITQWTNAMQMARQGILKGWSDEAVLKETKKYGAFSGAMRNPLVKMLDTVGINRILKLTSCAEIFKDDSLVHFTSCFTNPIFDHRWNSANGSEIKAKALFPFFNQSLKFGFFKELEQLPDAYVVAIGDAKIVMDYAVNTGIIDHERLITGIPHPSLQNPRVSYFIGKKTRSSFKETRTMSDGSVHKSSNNLDKVDEDKAQAIDAVNRILATEGGMFT